MRDHRQRLTVTVTAVAFIVASAACASVSVKERAVIDLQGLHQVLAAAQDTEISLYTSGTVPALTEAKHRQFHTALSKAFAAEITLATALRTWRAGDPAPASSSEVVALARETLTVVADLAPQASALVAAVQSWLDTAVAVQAMFRTGGLQ